MLAPALAARTRPQTRDTELNGVVWIGSRWHIQLSGEASAIVLRTTGKTITYDVALKRVGGRSASSFNAHNSRLRTLSALQVVDAPCGTVFALGDGCDPDAQVEVPKMGHAASTQSKDVAENVLRRPGILIAHGGARPYRPHRMQGLTEPLSRWWPRGRTAQTIGFTARARLYPCPRRRDASASRLSGTLPRTRHIYTTSCLKMVLVQRTHAEYGERVFPLEREQQNTLGAVVGDTAERADFLSSWTRASSRNCIKCLHGCGNRCGKR